MEQCPKCGCYMHFNMTYFCGSPFIYYTCQHCNYDSRDCHNTATTTITEVANSHKVTL